MKNKNRIRYFGTKERNCDICGKIFKSFDKKYCSRDCYRSIKGNLTKNDVGLFIKYENGKLFWINHWHPVHKAKLVGREAGNICSKGYREISFLSKKIRTHNVVWFLCKGKWPTGEIDHINRIKTDNRIENLRDVSHKENMNNFEHKNANPMTGYHGVYIDFRKTKSSNPNFYMAKFKKEVLGHYPTATYAAISRDKFLVKNKINRKLAFPFMIEEYLSEIR